MSLPYQTSRVITRYDRYVKAMRVLLPVAAASLAAVLILWPLMSERETSFLLSQERLERSGEEVRIVGPTYRGTDERDRVFTLSAAEAVQPTRDAPVVALSGLEAEMVLEDGRIARVEAAEGRYDTRTEIVEIPGRMAFSTSDGYALAGRDAVVDLDAKTVSSDAPVSGRAPIGTVEANGFEVDIVTRRAVFKNGVSAVTRPGERE